MEKIDYICCFTGSPSSGKQEMHTFLAIFDLSMNGLRVGIRAGYSCNIYSARNGALTGGKKGRRVDQKPFEGMYVGDYKGTIWIDSDNFVTAQQIEKLISYDVDIVAAYYRQYAGQGLLDDTNKTACGFWSIGPDHFTAQPITIGEMEKIKIGASKIQRNDLGLVEVDYAGMGLMIVKRDVFEAIGYPWFKAWTVEWVENGVPMAEIMTDDGGFCYRAKQAGFKVYVDPEMKIPHEKQVAV
jgi:hypothetical protein